MCLGRVYEVWAFDAGTPGGFRFARFLSSPFIIKVRFFLRVGFYKETPKKKVKRVLLRNLV